MATPPVAGQVPDEWVRSRRFGDNGTGPPTVQSGRWNNRTEPFHNSRAAHLRALSVVGADLVVSRPGWLIAHLATIYADSRVTMSWPSSTLSIALVDVAQARRTLISLTTLLPRRTPQCCDVNQQTAVELYSHAISIVLGSDRQERRQLATQTQLARRYRAEIQAIDRNEWVSYLKGAVPEELYAACTISEWFDGSGPARLRGGRIPLEARIIAVAEHWAALTVNDSPQLSHDEALGDLDACAGTHYDPMVVRAAHLAVLRGIVMPSNPSKCVR